MQNFEFSDFVKNKVWEKAKIDPLTDPNIWRRDACNAWLKRTDYGDRNSSYGWEIDHIVPVSQQVSDDLDNLQPLHWLNNQSKGDGELICSIG